jgi:hypothetical protein
MFMTEATQYVTNVPFILKVVIVALGSFNLLVTQRVFLRNASDLEVSSRVRGLALSSALSWTMVVVTGRLIAYL